MENSIDLLDVNRLFEELAQDAAGSEEYTCVEAELFYLCTFCFFKGELPVKPENMGEFMDVYRAAGPFRDSLMDRLRRLYSWFFISAFIRGRASAQQEIRDTRPQPPYLVPADFWTRQAPDDGADEEIQEGGSGRA